MTRASRTAYYEQAIRVLGEDGFSALTIGGLSEALEVTSGSFYHHFGSWNGFVEGLVEHWEQEQTERIIELTRLAADPLARFDRLIELAVTLPHAAEAAIRAWANTDPIVAQAQHRVDAARIQFVDDLMTEALDDPERSRTIGIVVVATYVGLEQLGREIGSTGFANAMQLLRDLIASDAAARPAHIDLADARRRPRRA
jgi:AcrR family transcriptional regulator